MTLVEFQGGRQVVNPVVDSDSGDLGSQSKHLNSKLASFFFFLAETWYCSCWPGKARIVGELF